MECHQYSARRRIGRSFGTRKALIFYRFHWTAKSVPMKSIREGRSGQGRRELLPGHQHRFRQRTCQIVRRPRYRRQDVIQGRDQTVLIHASLSIPAVSAVTAYPSIPITSSNGRKIGIRPSLPKIAREINNAMPAYSVELLQDILNEMKLPLNGNRRRRPRTRLQSEYR